MELHYDGHGLNDEKGERVLTFARRPDRDGGGYLLDAETRKEIAAELCAARDLLAVAKSCADDVINDAEEGSYRHCCGAEWTNAGEWSGKGNQHNPSCAAVAAVVKAGGELCLGSYTPAGSAG